MRFTKNGIMPSGTDAETPHSNRATNDEGRAVAGDAFRTWRRAGLLGPSSDRTVFQCVWMGAVSALLFWAIWHYVPILTGWAWDWSDENVHRDWKFGFSIILASMGVLTACHAFWLGVHGLRALRILR